MAQNSYELRIDPAGGDLTVSLKAANNNNYGYMLWARPFGMGLGAPIEPAGWVSKFDNDNDDHTIPITDMAGGSIIVAFKVMPLAGVTGNYAVPMDISQAGAVIQTINHIVKPADLATNTAFSVELTT